MIRWLQSFRRRTLMEQLIQAESQKQPSEEELQALEQRLLRQYPPPAQPTSPDLGARRIRAMIAYGTTWEKAEENVLLTAEEREGLEWVAIPHRWARMRRYLARKENP